MCTFDLQDEAMEGDQTDLVVFSQQCFRLWKNHHTFVVHSEHKSLFFVAFDHAGGMTAIQVLLSEHFPAAC